MKKNIALFVLTLMLLSNVSLADHHKNAASTQSQAIDGLMDGLHIAASNADLDGYLGSFTNTGVFMGTDDWERWTRPTTLDAYVKERFATAGWTYKSVERHINFAENGQTAWFDEIIVSEKWGRFRGTGVVVKKDDVWKVAHYSMTVLVANEAFFDIAKINKEAFAQRAAPSNNQSNTQSNTQSDNHSDAQSNTQE